jgi:hypothetical protein
MTKAFQKSLNILEVFRNTKMTLNSTRQLIQVSASEKISIKARKVLAWLTIYI